MDATPQNNARIRVTPVVETMPADLLTPLAVYLKLSQGSTHSFLLESVAGGANLARYSFIGADPVEILSGGRETYQALREHFASYFGSTSADLPPFIGGAIGYLGFDACEWFEPSLGGNKESDDVCLFMFYRSIVAFDHARQLIKIITLDFDGETKTAVKKNAVIRQVLEHPNVPMPISPAGATPRDICSNWTRTNFEAAVGRIKELINAGECYQAVLSQCFTRPTNASAVSIYRALRSLNPSPYMFLLQLDGKAIIGASPEMLVRCVCDRLEYRPIAGTRPRGSTDAEDAVFAAEMRGDKKEVAEHLMLVDLGRNDLGRVAEYGSVEVEMLLSVEKYSHVQHLVSSLSARLRASFDRFDALAACFPAGTVSGAPKVRAIEIVRDLEPTGRGIYAGAVGYFDYAGNMDTCIAIRTLVLEEGVVTIQAGAGIVADSVPELEFDETVNKAKGLMQAVDIAETNNL